VFQREIDGQPLTFHLAGINNQNFLMRDEETGTFWQQIGAKAIAGPLAGRALPLVHADELTFATWKAENPLGTVLAPLAAFAPEYEAKDWETHMAKARTVVDTTSTGHPPRELMLGVEAFGSSRAFPLDRVLSQKLVQDRVGAQPILLVVAWDGASVRAFRARLPQRESPVEFYRKVAPRIVAKLDPTQPLFVDSKTGSEWNFAGCAVSGTLRGTCLEPLNAIKDFWFDWHVYHPQTTIYQR